jgi:hypothetical protein
VIIRDQNCSHARDDSQPGSLRGGVEGWEASTEAGFDGFLGVGHFDVLIEHLRCFQPETTVRG